MVFFSFVGGGNVCRYLIYFRFTLRRLLILFHVLLYYFFPLYGRLCFGEVCCVVLLCWYQSGAHFFKRPSKEDGQDGEIFHISSSEFRSLNSMGVT